MVNKYQFTVALLVMLISTFVIAQDIQVQDPVNERIRGARFIPYPTYSGSPFLNDKFISGEIEFMDGTKQENVILNYGMYRDELIYYNTAISTQIVIDKKSLNGFSFIDREGKKRTFRKLSYDGSFQGDFYFEVLSQGNISLLAYRKVNLETCDTYNSKTGMSYQTAFTYFLYSPEKGFAPINPTRNSLLSKFSKTNQKLIRKTLRKNGVYISDETSFVTAWNLIKENRIQTEF